jgi:hypothetical protein
LLRDKSNRQGIAVHLTFTRFDGREDYENNIEDVQHRQESKTDEQETENASDEIVDQHRDLKVQRLFPMRVDLGRLTTLDQPNNERPKNVSKGRDHKSRQSAQMARYAPSPNIP